MRLAAWKLALILAPVLAAALIVKFRRGNFMHGIRFNILYRLGEKRSAFLRRFTVWSRVALLFLLALSLLRPQLVNAVRSFDTEGISIMLLFDVSGSMEAQDFTPNRFQAARSVLRSFISDRKNDRIGLVVFAGEAYTACPLTVDYEVLTDFLDKVSMGRLTDGTAIGDALGVAIGHLRKSRTKSRVAILLTDGENNAGSVRPELAAEWAGEDGIKIYTIGVGSEKGGTIPVMDQFGRVVGSAVTKLDEELLEKIASITGARYFRATDKQKLSQIYQQIDQLEKTHVQARLFYNYNELFPWLLWAALACWIAVFYYEDLLLRIP